MPHFFPAESLLSFHSYIHSSHQSLPGGEESEQEIVGDQSWEQAFFAQALGGFVVDKQLCAKAQQEEKHQDGDIEDRIVGDGEGRPCAEGQQRDE